MAMTYVPSLKGYVTDVPEIWLKRKDNKVFHFDQLSSSNVSPDTQFTEVNAGWSLYPVAYLPGQSTMEMTFESAQFDADLFALATNTEFKNETVEVWGSAIIEATEEGQHEFVIESEADLTNAKFYINGFTQINVEKGALSKKGYFVAVTPAQGDSPADKNWFEYVDGKYIATADAAVEAGKTYYKFEEMADAANENTGYTKVDDVTNANPKQSGWYEVNDNGEYVLTEDATPGSGKTYYTKNSADTYTADQDDKAGVHTVASFRVLDTVKDSSTGVYRTKIILTSKDNSGLAKGDQLEVSYVYAKSLATIQVDNQQTFVGEAILKWPVYASGEETKAAGVKGYMIMHIYKCRCTAMPGFDTSYKSTATNGITLSAMDSHRQDGAIYSMSYLEK